MPDLDLRGKVILQSRSKVTLARERANPAALKSEIRSPEIRRKSETRNPRAEIAQLSGIGSALDTEATGASVSRSDRTE
jgi:hypothetical protein